MPKKNTILFVRLDDQIRIDFQIAYMMLVPCRKEIGIIWPFWKLEVLGLVNSGNEKHYLNATLFQRKPHSALILNFSVYN